MQITCLNSSSICVNTPTFKCTVSSGRKVSPKQRHQHHLVPKWKTHNLNFLSCRYSHLPGAKICTPKNIKSPRFVYDVVFSRSVLWKSPKRWPSKAIPHRDFPPKQRIFFRMDERGSPFTGEHGAHSPKQKRSRIQLVAQPSKQWEQW